MTSGGWHGQEPRHGRHRRGTTGAAWTPAVRPTDTGPAHLRRDGGGGFRPTDTAPAWPSYRSEVLTRRPGWPVDDGPVVPVARAAEPGRPRPAAPVAWPTEQDMARIPAPLRAEQPRHTAPEPPKRKTVSADMYFDTVPMGRVRHRDEPVVYALSDTQATGLRKFDLGNVPASVTPPRTWRKAAWFAVGTSAAVVLGLAVASAELMGRTVDEPAIDALPAYPTGPLTLDKLPNEKTTDPTSTRRSTREPTKSTPVSQQEPPRDTVIGDTTGQDTEPPGTTTGGGIGSGTDGGSPAPTAVPAPTSPPRRTVGPQPLTPTDPQQMGDVTEAYFRAVTADPAAAHAMTTGPMAREGAEGIEARYQGVSRVEVQEITIDRNRAVTTSRVKVVREDGTATVEERQLAFTWGGDPKITEDSTTA